MYQFSFVLICPMDTLVCWLVVGVSLGVDVSELRPYICETQVQINGVSKFVTMLCLRFNIFNRRLKYANNYY